MKSDGFTVEYMPCSKCGSNTYDNCDTSEDCLDYNLKTGVIVLTPKSCDKCNFEWALSESNELH